MRIKYSLFVVVVVEGVGKGLGSVKETVSSIQELGKRRERELVTTPFLCKESTTLSGDTCHWVSSMSVIKADCHSPYYSLSTLFIDQTFVHMCVHTFAIFHMCITKMHMTLL